jgi:subtilisin-like proprotein convertase family protein
MQLKSTQKTNVVFFMQALSMFVLTCFISLSLFSQQYFNGNLSTGITSSNGVSAPVGYAWSEVQTGNEQAGFGAQIVNNFTIADNFSVNVASWTVSKVTFFAYSTGYNGATSPFRELRFQIFNTDPTVGNPTPVYGDLVTNRLSNSSTSGIYRIFNGTTNALREVWKLEANINAVLPPGNYWIEWQTGVATGVTSNLIPSSTVLGTTTQLGNNAKQHDLTANLWSNITDGTTIPNNFQDFPFVIDFTTSACTGTPVPGNTTSTAATACPGTNFTLGISNTFNGVGITYQWQSSSDNVTYNNITGGVNTTLTTNLATATWYRLAVTCGGSLAVGYSTPIQIAQTPANGCYCTSSATSIRDEEILRVKVGTLDNTSTCSSLAPGPNSVTNRYSNYTSGVGAPAPGTIVSGGGNPITIQIGTCNTGSYTNSVAVWVDMNQNGVLEATEKAYVSRTGTPGAHTETGSLVIPSTALNGITLMRVVSVETFTPGNINPCGTYTWGETEDYLVNITPCTPAAISTQPANVTASCGGNASFTVGTSGDFPSFTWEYRTSATATWNFVTDGALYSGASTNTLNITGATNAMNGYQYRAVFIGACSATDFSNAVTLTVSPFVATVTPTSSTICNGSSQSIQITNLTSSNFVTATVASGTVNTLITDAVDAGVVSPSIVVSGIPVGSIVTNMNVKFNITHTWVGDLHINLIAPNGQVLNLVGALNNGTGSNATINFTNTVISSTSTNVISGAASPRTGTFAAEKRAGFGPTAYVQTATDWPALFTTLNGNWKLAMADFGFGDEGTLVNWEVAITYTAPSYAEGTWTPTTGLFTNAALTTPYTGGDTTTVYAAPTTSTNYTVIVATSLCSSAPLVIPVTVANPISSIIQPSSAEICENGNATFTSGASAGNPILYQWEESTDAGATWSNVVDGSVYSGANTAALSITGASTSMDGFKYRLKMKVVACSSNATSDAITLTVNGNPSLSISAAPHTSLFPGLQTTLTAVVTPAGTNNTFTWTLNGASLTDTDGSHNVDIDGVGTYEAIVTDQNGCVSAVSNSITITDSLNKSLFVYPNPNKGEFQIRYNDKLNGVSNPRSIVIYDARGSRVYRKQFTPNFPFGRMDVDLRQYGKGVYFIDLLDAAGVRLKAGRVVVY